MNNVQTPTVSNPASAKPATVNRLVFPHGVANLTLRVDTSMPDADRAAFYGPKPRVTEADGVISIDHPRFNPLIWGRTSADITLSPSVKWSIEIRDGVSRWDGDLRNIRLASIEVRGGVNQVKLRLPQPAGTVPIRVSGGVSHLTLQRPAGVPARVRIGGGASKLMLDTQYLGAIGGPVRLETPDYGSVADRYALEIGGGRARSRSSATKQAAGAAGRRPPHSHSNDRELWLPAGCGSGRMQPGLRRQNRRNGDGTHTPAAAPLDWRAGRLDHHRGALCLVAARGRGC